mmetsp:Transcript_1453/g.3635  ORF Transcript_1453/g.3635 Transcript_1453/m.3635 type:complete len:81 (+) Transcript_1453:126-368(+)
MRRRSRDRCDGAELICRKSGGGIRKAKAQLNGRIELRDQEAHIGSAFQCCTDSVKSCATSITASQRLCLKNHRSIRTINS